MPQVFHIALIATIVFGALESASSIDDLGITSCPFVFVLDF